MGQPSSSFNAMLVSRQFSLSRQKTLDFVSRLEAVPDKAVSLYLPFNLSMADAGDLLDKISGEHNFPEDLAEVVSGSKNGAVLFWGLERKNLISPPFPIIEKYISQGYDVEPIRSLLVKDYLIALVLVRLGAYAIGVCQGERLVTSKVGTGLVHARHKQGGSSQARFARHREKQIESFMTRVCGHAREQLEPYAQTIDFMTYGGARTTILLLQKQCPFLKQFDDRTLPPLLDIPDPRQAVLEGAVGRIWSSDVVEWREEES